ncbi:MAG: IS66 family insertion sequence element accessory protein TnpA [Phycisphaeraceae bacterium]
MSIVGFCRERGLAVSTFHAWRRRLGEERTASSAERGFVRLRVGDESLAGSGSSGFPDDGIGARGGDGGEVRAEGGDRSGGDASVEPRPVVVRFADGVEVHIDARQLAEVLSCLRDGSADGRTA